MIIGIGGVSNAGKSSLANLLKRILEKELKVKILCQDDFIIAEHKIPKINGITDWECPRSINHKMFLQAVRREKQNNDIVISEGLFAFHDDNLSKLYDKKLFLFVDKDTFKLRKLRDKRWGKVPEWYIDHIWDFYIIKGRAKDAKGVKKIDATQLFDLDDIVKFIKS